MEVKCYGCGLEIYGVGIRFRLFCILFLDNPGVCVQPFFFEFIANGQVAANSGDIVWR